MALIYQVEQIYCIQHLPWRLVLIRWTGKRESRKGITHSLVDPSPSHLWPTEKAPNHEPPRYDFTSQLLFTGCVISGN